ncbi:hypothetical protein K435DRAFT_772053 [Dendrothele bispora CBS 962.96]|uniref:Actin cytoskeleton-regulatory complex protein SLA1 n=1 Tax=Dendrothele bispora (strain CBS 962.96) TaxID=1314807 RepID=A0A4S8N0J7_DENBC|nr:hypothetical protein K435DRAFT_772053 [Dendrothele bispora CBS 962.96]
MSSDPYLAVLKASYDYDPQSDDEISVKEDQILFLLERTDDDWWKVKVKTSDDSGPSGLVPAAYVEQAEHSSIVKALYDYEASAPGELTVQEDEVLLAFNAEDEWLLVQSTKEGGKAGLVPVNYVETHSEEEAQSVAPSIVIPPSPPPVASTYVDPAERVSHNKVNSADEIKTWSISELDKKGKKIKGTLGIGNGAVFFASETSKAAVQKWQTSDIDNISIEKSKHVRFDVGGATPTNLHFHAGSKDNAEAIVEKLKSSKSISSASSSSAAEPAATPEPKVVKPSQIDVTKKASVHFSPASPDIIPPRSPSPEEDEEDYGTVNGIDHADGEAAVALYDFKADGDDELTVSEGDQLVVIEKDGDEWWKCRNVHHQEGMVPASYVELSAPNGAGTSGKPSHQEEEEEEEEEEEDDSAAVAAQAAAAAAEEKARADAAAKAAAEAERARAEREEREKKEKRKQEAARAAAAAEAERKKRQEAAAARAQSSPSPQGRPESSGSKKAERPSSTSGSGRLNENGRPPADQVRTWHDRSGQFRVDAALLNYKDGKLRLHKTNGVIVEVPSEKMSVEDMKYVERLMAKKSRPPADDDNIPLATLQRSQSQARPRSSQQPKKGPTIDWFEFFLSAGCDIDDCTRYAASFERDKIDEAILPDITESTMRSLGLREGDIIRVTKVIEKRKPQEPRSDKRQEQIARDEEYARQLQAQENGGGSATRGPTNLFTNGPDGSLKPGRRGRPTPSKSLPVNVDLNAIGAVSEQMQRTTSPQLLSPDGTGRPSSAAPVQPPPRSSSAAPATSGFDDDAWTNRPSSTKPLTPNPAASVPRAPSAPPATTPAATAPETQAQSPPQPSPAPIIATASAPTTTAPTPPMAMGPPSLAKTTEADIFDQLARLEQIRKTTPAQVPPPTVQSPPVAPSPPVASPPPAGFASGMGMGNSPLTMSQHLQNQQTGVYNGPRGPFAPVPANQALLQPLIPTQTGFNSFVPTRPASSPLGTLNSQSTGFPGQQPLASQPTGFPGMQQPMMSQPTGMPFGGMNNMSGMGGMSGMNGMNAPNPFGSGSTFSPVMSNPTGFNPGFGQFNNGMSSPPPVPSNSNNNNSANPANIFAQMKSGTFATENDTSVPQSADKYNALRPQPTGWGTFGQGSYVGGF